MAHVEEEPRKVQYPLDSNCYELVDEIGRGVSAVVYKAACAAMNSPEAAMVAIKCIDLERSRTDLDKARREAQTMFLLSHPNVLGAYCSFTVDHSLWVVMPFMSGGSLRSIMSSSFPDGLSEPCIAVILRETLSALAYLHGQGHLHRDVKAGNILIDSNGSVKLADFGVSASVYEAAAGAATAMLTDMAGTPYWMAPEVVHSHVGYSFKADIWSFGITALELAHGRPPLSHLPPCKSLMMKITKRFRFSDHYQKTRSSKGKKFSKSFKHMVGLCLDQDPSKRPSAEKLLKHPFFKTCKGSEFLAKNILQGLPSVEQRYKLEAQLQRLGSTKRTEEDAGNEDEEFPARGSPKQRRISGWNFNEDVFELDPVFPTTKELVPTESSDIVKQVRFGGESIIQDKKANSNPNSPKEAAEVGQREGEPSRQDGGTDRSPMLEGLVVLKKSLDAQRRRVAYLIALFTGEEAEEELVERLKTELENEKAKNSQLENQVEFLESQLAIAYTLLDSS